MLTLTYYTPYNHNIAFLRSLAEGLDRRRSDVWPDANRSERAMFQKRKEAYTQARYSKLCRAPYYAERREFPRLFSNFAAIGSA